MSYSQFTRLMNWSAIAISLSLLALVSYQLYMRHLVPQAADKTYQFDDLPGEVQAPVTADIDAIINRHMFGEVPIEVARVEPTIVRAEPKLAPKTRLNIKLTGVIVGTTSENGMAMMEVDRGRTVVVAVGEKIDKTDAVLHQVLPGEILIDRDGTIESVKMVRKSLNIVKLKSELLDALPQPYVEDARVDTYQKPTPGPASSNSGQPLSAPGTSGAGAQGETRYSDTGERISPENLPRTPREPMKTLPVPRMLQ